jgi:hypothetical protein
MMPAPGSAQGGAEGARDAAAADAAPTAPTDAQRAGANVPPGVPRGLPLVVTEHYQNRGWFGDPAIAARFAGSDVIRESESVTGPCAARPSGARGKCLQFTYTPPAGFTPAAGSYVGDFFLRTLLYYHPELAPTPRPGTANWGVEPAIALAANATRLSFHAAAAQDGVMVTFRAGIERDAFVVPPLEAKLTTRWQALAIPLGGIAYGHNLFGPFGWMLTDLGEPVTFYVDDIVWEGDGPPPEVPPAAPLPATPPPAPPAQPTHPAPPAPPGKLDGVRQVTVINRCQQTIWVGAFGNPVPAGGGFRLDAGQSTAVTLPGGTWTGRFWGRTGCRFDANGIGACDTGGCGAKLACAGATGAPPATLVELTLGAGGVDFYDVSLVDGYNLPMAVAPMPGGFTARPGVANDCAAPTCGSDLAASCPADLGFRAADGDVVGCLSACERFRTDELCCAGAHATPDTCPASPYARAWKAACPSAYSYAYDDATSTFTCKGEDYAIWFCP